MIARDYTPVVLAGGLGTRLAGVLPGVPKALATVSGRPFITFLLDALVDAGFNEIVLCVGFLADQMEERLGTKYREARLIFARETVLNGTGGALRFAVDSVQSDWCLALNGDSFCEVDFADFIAWHTHRAESIGLVVQRAEDVSRYGEVKLGSDGRILGFVEKSGDPRSGWINAGIYSLPVALIKELSRGRVISLEREIFPEWLARGMAGFRAEGAFIDIGTPESYLRAEGFFGRRREHAKSSP